MNVVFVAQTQEKNAINSAGLSGGTEPAHKCVLRMGLLVGRALAIVDIIVLQSSLNLPF